MRRDDDQAARSLYWLLWGLGILVTLYLVMPFFQAPELVPQQDRIDFADKDYERRNLSEEEFIHGFNPGPWPDPEKEPIRKFENRSGHEAHVTSIFVNWTTPFNHARPNITYIVTEGSVPMITWAPHKLTTPEIADGSREIPQSGADDVTADEYIDSWATGVCELSEASEQPILMRPMHEMNGGWFTWGISYQTDDGEYPNSNESFREAWITIYDAFRDRCGPENVQFIWSTNHFSTGKGASYTGAYPGDEYVEYVGLDGYNWGGHEDWGWATFDSLFKDVYCAVTDTTDLPIVLAEWGSVEKGGDKAEWMRRAFERIRSGEYKQIVGSIYFDQAKYERESDSFVEWNIDSSPESLEAYRQGIDALMTEGVDQGGMSICEG